MNVSVIIPAYNEINTLSAVIKKVQATLYRKEIIIVDDGSKDGTREWLEKQIADGLFSVAGLSANRDAVYAWNGADNEDIVSDGHSHNSNSNGYSDINEAMDNQVKVIFHERNRGKSGAVWSGMQVAAGDVIIIQDADLEYDPKDYQALFKPIIEGEADVVYGSRFLSGHLTIHQFWIYMGNKIVTLVSNMFTGIKLTDMETCYKVFKREVLEGIKIESLRFGFEPEITAKVSKKGCRIVEVPISYNGRSYKDGKKITWKDGIKAIFTIIKYNVFKKD